MRAPLTTGLLLALALFAGVESAQAQNVTVVLTQIEGSEAGAPFVDPALKSLEGLFAKNPIFKVYKRLRMLNEARKSTKLGTKLVFRLPGGLRCEVTAGVSKRKGFVRLDCDVVNSEKPPKVVAHFGADLKDGGTAFLKPGQPKDLVLGITVQTGR